MAITIAKTDNQVAFFMNGECIFPVDILFASLKRVWLYKYLLNTCYVDYCSSFVRLLLTNVLSVLLGITASDYPSLQLNVN